MDVKNKIKSVVRKFFKTLLLAAFFIFTLFPFYWLLVSSLKSSKDLYEVPIRYWPKTVSFENYQEVFGMGNFLVYIKNSLVVAFCVAALSVIVCYMTAYVLARMEFKLKPIVFMIFMMTQMLPGAVGFAPIYALVSKLGLLDRLSTVIVILSCGQVTFGTLLMIGFLKGVPKALEEAAMIDGCGRLKAVFRIVLPLAKAGLFTVFIFVFLAAWNDVYTSVLYIDGEERKTLTVVIYSMMGKYDINWGNVAAGTLIAMTPAVILFACMKKMFVENIAGAVKE